MNKFDSDATYCSEVEGFSKEETKTNQFVLRRSQRLLQNTISEKSDLKNYEITGKARSHNGSSQLHLEAIVDGSIAKPLEPCSLKTSPHSRDILEQCQTQSFSEKLPLNQKYFTTNGNCNRKSNSDSRIYLKRKLKLMVNNFSPPTLRGECKKVKKNAADIASSDIQVAVLKSKVNNSSTEDSIKACPIDTSNQTSNTINSNVEKKLTKCASTNRSNKGTKPIQKYFAKKFSGGTIENMNKLMPSNDIKSQQNSQQCKKRGRKRKCLNDKSEANNVERLNYTDPIGKQRRTITKMPTIQPTQKMLHFDNAIVPPTMSYDTVRQSLLPRIYPQHFQHQLPLPTESTINAALPSLNATAGLLASNNEPNLFLTPEISQILQNPTPSTAQSSPDSLRDLFDSTEIREILNIEKITYRLTERHVQALAIVLNLRFEYLCGVFEKILKLNSNMLQRIDEVFKMSNELDEMDIKKITDRIASPAASEISNSQSPTLQRYFQSQRQT